MVTRMSNSVVQSVLSLALLLVGLWLHGRGSRRTGTVLVVAVITVISTLLFVLYFISDYFTGDGINEAVIYHLRYGLTGAGFSEYAALAGLALLVLLACLAVLLRLLLHRSLAVRPAGSSRIAVALAFTALSLTLHPATADIARLLPATAPGLAAYASEDTRRREREVQEDFDRHHVQTAARIAAGARKNLVLIYAESLERSYFDETLFPGLMPRLRALESAALTFTDIVQAPGTGWTIAGMVASQCGIPLFTPSHGNSMSGLDSYLPAAHCLGDLLKDDGYHLAYLGGARLRFAGKGKFYQTHRFDEIAGLDELQARQRDTSYVNPWGLYDDEMLELAFDKFLALSKTQERFGLFLLTLDTHHPDGHLSATCRGMRYGNGDNPILNAVHCSDRLIAEFVERIRRSEWGKRTLIVIASDHLAMRNSAYDLLERVVRRNLFLVIDPDAAAAQRIATRGSMMDVAPTLLELMGHDSRLGLGNSLLKEDSAAAERRHYILRRLSDWMVPLAHFWDFPRIDNRIEVDAQARKVIIDGRSFAVPAFIAIDRDMRTTIKFPYLSSARDFVAQNSADKAFVLIAECASRDHRLPAGILCLFAGRGDRFRTQLIVRDNVHFSPQEIMRMAGAG